MSFYAVDFPPVKIGIILHLREWKCGEHELPFHFFQNCQEPPHIVFIEGAVIVGTVGSQIWRVNKVEGIRGVVSFYYLNGIPALNGNPFQTVTQGLGYVVFGIV